MRDIWVFACLDQAEPLFHVMSRSKVDDDHVQVIDRRIGDDDPKMFVGLLVPDEEGVPGDQRSISEDIIECGLGSFLFLDNLDHLVLALSS